MLCVANAFLVLRHLCLPIIRLGLPIIQLYTFNYNIMPLRNMHDVKQVKYLQTITPTRARS